MPNNYQTQKAIIYCRSAVSGDHAEIALRDREARCRAYATERGYEIIAVFQDKGFPGTMRDRPGIADMWAFLKRNTRGSGPIVLIDDISQLARDMCVYLEFRQELSNLGCAVESPSFHFRDTPEDRLLESFLASRAQYEKHGGDE